MQTLTLKKELAKEYGYKNVSISQRGSWLHVVVKNQPEVTHEDNCEWKDLMGNCLRCKQARADRSSALENKVLKLCNDLKMVLSTFMSDDYRDSNHYPCVQAYFS